GDGLGEVVGELREETATPGWGFVEVAAGEVPTVQDGEDVPVDDGPERFEKVEGHAVAVLGVGVADAQRRVEGDRVQREAAFGFGERVAVVQHGVDRVGGGARAGAGDEAAAHRKVGPVLGDIRQVLFGE